MLQAERTITIDLTHTTPHQWAEILARACRLGSVDATSGNSDLSGRAIAANLGITTWRKGHLDALRCAYRAGRFHVDTMGMR